MPGDIRASMLNADARADHQSLVPDVPLSRRGFVMTSLSAGFAAAAMPVSAQTVITTDTKDLSGGRGDHSRAQRQDSGLSRPAG